MLDLPQTHRLRVVQKVPDLYVRFTGSVTYPPASVAHKSLHIINRLSLGGVRACACVLRCADSVKVVCTIESVTDLLILVIFIKGHQRNTHAFTVAGWLGLL